VERNVWPTANTTGKGGGGASGTAGVRPVTDSLSSELASLRIDRAPRRGLRQRLAARVGRRRMGAEALDRARVLAVLAASGRPRGSARPRWAAVGGGRWCGRQEISPALPAQASVDSPPPGTWWRSGRPRSGPNRGRIARTYAKEGDRCSRGDVLFELDPTDQRNELAAARRGSEVARAGQRCQGHARGDHTLARTGKKAGVERRGGRFDRGKIWRRSPDLCRAGGAGRGGDQVAVGRCARSADTVRELRCSRPSTESWDQQAAAGGARWWRGRTGWSRFWTRCRSWWRRRGGGPRGRGGRGRTLRDRARCVPNARHRGQVAMVGPRLKSRKATALVKCDVVERCRTAGRMAARVGVFARRPGRQESEGNR